MFPRWARPTWRDWLSGWGRRKKRSPRYPARAIVSSRACLHPSATSFTPDGGWRLIEPYRVPGRDEKENMARIDEMRLLTKVARMYYERGLRQAAIADQLN